MEDEDLHSLTDKHTTRTEIDGEIYDSMHHENNELFDNLFSFKNVLLIAVVLGVIILIAYGLGRYL